MSCLQEIVSRFPIRKKDEQKDAFLKWAGQQARMLGYDARVEEAGKKGQHRNFVVGDPEKTQVVFTAHYDTPAVSFMPNIMMPRNLILFYLYQFCIVGVLLAVSLAAMFAAEYFIRDAQISMIIFLVVYYALLIAMIKGPANKNNVNDNTSGVAAVFALMEKLSADVREKAAFILFDNEEKGKLGSKAYAAAHENVKKNTLVINMDCVGVGDDVLVIAKPLAQAMGEYACLKESFAQENGKTPHFYRSTFSMVNSDQSNFRAGVAVCACRRAPVVGFYTPYLHTKRDTVADEANIGYLADSLSEFVEKL